MTVTIIPIIDHEQYNVNGHIMYKDSNNNWNSRTDMSNTELTAFRDYKKLVIDNKSFKTHTKATYNK